MCKGFCEITHSKLDLVFRDGVHNPYAPSLDQIVPGQGYVPGNIQIVAVWYNRMKGGLTDSEAIQILRSFVLSNNANNVFWTHTST